MKLWEKGISVNKEVEKFTTGKDRELDLLLAPWDILGSMAHLKMLTATGLLDESESQLLLKELKKIYKSAGKGEFIIEEGIEDVHSQVEKVLTQKLGNTGKKIHTARSRNDQVLLDIRLFTRNKLQHLIELVLQLFTLFQEKSESGREILMPGYTHLQVAMPSSFGLWFGSFAESLSDDMTLLSAAWQMNNQNPLGTAAGYGSSFPIKRQITTELLGFNDLVWNSMYAQTGRGKVEKTVAFALASIAGTLSKFAMDATLFMSQNFNFIQLTDDLTTGSSIMPHKKNPDVFELIRANCNKLQALPYEISLITGNLSSGYHRDYQLLKENYLPAFNQLVNTIQMTMLILENMKLNEHILDDEKYNNIFSVEEINKKVHAGIPFRTAYQEVAKAIAGNEFKPDKNLHHTHEGSIGNLGNSNIKTKMDQIIRTFNFQIPEKAINSLLKE